MQLLLLIFNYMHVPASVSLPDQEFRGLNLCTKTVSITPCGMIMIISIKLMHFQLAVSAASVKLF